MHARSYFVLIIVTAACVCTCPVLADTTWVAGGDVSGNWTSAGSPYMIQGDLRVPPMETLQIGPGVIVFFAVRCSLLVDSAARLEAIGAENDSVYFTTDTLALPERWGGIDLNPDADTCRFEWCVVEYAGGANNSRAISVHSAPFVLLSSTLRYNSDGAGAFTASIRVSNCLFIGNSSNAGGALWIFQTNGLIEDCVFSNNHGIAGPGAPPTWGGAINFSAQTESLVVRNCTFMDNTAGIGGAVNVEIGTNEFPLFEDCQFLNNFASRYGGAIGNYSPGIGGDFRSCLFDGNASDSLGGALYLADQTIVEQCVIKNNHALRGGGIYLADGDYYAVTIDQCVVLNNLAEYGGGVYNEASSSQPKIYRSTLIGNSATSGQGGGIYAAGIGNWPIVRGCIIAYTGQGHGLRISPTGNPPFQPHYRPGFNLFFANTEGDFSPNESADYGVLADTNRNGDSSDTYKDIFLDPQLVDTANGDYQLLSTSPCIDAGDPLLSLDPDSTIADIGAYYYDQTDAVDETFIPYPSSLILSAFPNPFNGSTEIRFELPVTSNVKLAVFDLLGREVAALLNEPIIAGAHSIHFDASDLPSGLYFCRLQAGDILQTHKLILLK